MMRFRWICFLAILLATPIPSFAKEKNPIPRFTSLRSDKVNVRVGPGPQYPIEWTYTKVGLPVEVIAEFDTWRKIRDVHGTVGWVHQTMLNSKRRAIIKDPSVLLYSNESVESAPLARLQKGVIVELFRCQTESCQVRIDAFKGWVSRTALWGVYPHESLK